MVAVWNQIGSGANTRKEEEEKSKDIQFFDLAIAILIVCGLIARSARFGHAVALLETCRAHLFAKLSKSPVAHDTD